MPCIIRLYIGNVICITIIHFTSVISDNQHIVMLEAGDHVTLVPVLK